MTDAALRREIVDVCRRLAERGLVAGQDGNVSARLDRRRLLVTPAGASKARLRVTDIVEITTSGAVRRRSQRPTTELAMHLRLYARRDDIAAVVHAHPPMATAFAVAGEDFMTPVLPEIILGLGRVPLLPYATPGTEAVADEFEPFVHSHDAFLMANHGATTVGTTLERAHQRMESLEHAARILFGARLLGRVNALSARQVEQLVTSKPAAIAYGRGRAR